VGGVARGLWVAGFGCFSKRPTRNLQTATCNLQPATCNLQPATCGHQKFSGFDFNSFFRHVPSV